MSAPRPSPYQIMIVVCGFLLSEDRNDRSHRFHFRLHFPTALSLSLSRSWVPTKSASIIFLHSESESAIINIMGFAVQSDPTEFKLKSCLFFKKSTIERVRERERGGRWESEVENDVATGTNSAVLVWHCDCYDKQTLSSKLSSKNICFKIEVTLECKFENRCSTLWPIKPEGPKKSVAGSRQSVSQSVGAIFARPFQAANFAAAGESYPHEGTASLFRQSWKENRLPLSHLDVFTLVARIFVSLSDILTMLSP